MELHLQIRLSDAERTRLLRPVNGVGGFQSLIKKLQRNLEGNVVSITSVDDMDKVLRYVRRYKKGGFQSRLRALSE